LEHICQVHTDAAGNQVVSTVQAYFQQLMSAARPFSSQRSFPVSISQQFMDGNNPCLLTGFCCCFPDQASLRRSTGLISAVLFSLCSRPPSKRRTTLHQCNALLAMPLAFLKLFRRLDMLPGPTRHWPCPARPKQHSVGILHGEDLRPSLQPAKVQGQQGRWPAMAVGGRIHGQSTNRDPML
jgi:hypothetical protein